MSELPQNDTKLAIQGGTEGNSLHHRPGAARLASEEQLRIVPRPEAGTGGGRSYPTLQSVNTLSQR